MRDLFPNATYSLNDDAVTIGESLSTVLTRLAANVPTGNENIARYWSYAVTILDQQAIFLGYLRPPMMLS